MTGPHARTLRTYSQWVVGPGRTPQRTSGRGWESARPPTLHAQARGAPTPAPSCRSHSAQSQLARARAVGLVTGRHTCTPRTNSQWVLGPGSTPQRTSGRGWEGARPQTPHIEARGPPPRHPRAAPTACKASSQERALWVADGSPRPHLPHPKPVGSGPRPHAPKDGQSGVGERPTPDASRPGKRRPPQARSCRPHSAQSQLARAHAVGSVTGPHARIPRTHSQWVVGPGSTPQRPCDRGWESARPRTPHTQARGAAPGRPLAAPTARKASSQERPLWGW